MSHERRSMPERPFEVSADTRQLSSVLELHTALAGLYSAAGVLERHTGISADGGLSNATEVIERKIDAAFHEGKSTLDAADGYEFIIERAQESDEHVPVVTGMYMPPKGSRATCYIANPQITPAVESSTFTATSLEAAHSAIFAVNDQDGTCRALSLPQGLPLGDKISHMPTQP